VHVLLDGKFLIVAVGQGAVVLGVVYTPYLKELYIVPREAPLDRLSLLFSAVTSARSIPFLRKRYWLEVK
jgi:hypothetical protein